MNQPLRVALFGSPSFALPVLNMLHRDYDLVLVVVQPDKPAGRGNKLTSPPVAQWVKDSGAKNLGVRLEQPAKLRKNEDFFELVKALDLDVAITAAYGKILPQALLDIPKHGFLNVHASLLPKYRGAAPIQWALINGEEETGVSIMQTEAGLDTGPVRHVKRLELAPRDTALTLFEDLSTLGAEALCEALVRLARGDLPCVSQNDTQATFAPLLTKEDGEIRWDSSAREVYNRFRGVMVWPGTWTTHGGKMLKVHELVAQQGAEQGRGEAGEVLSVDASGILVGTGEGAVLLQTVQPAGKARMSAYDFANGYGVKAGQSLG